MRHKMSRIRRLMKDRRAQGIAAIVGAGLLLVIAAVLGISLLSAPGEVGEAGPSASPSPEPTQSGSPLPSATEPDPTAVATAVPTPTPSPPAMALDRPIAATVLVDDLRVRELPGEGTPVASLDAGEVVLMQYQEQEIDGIAWYLVTATGTDEPTYGWVSAGPDDDPYLQLHWTLAHQIPATIHGLAGGDGGYLAWGYNARESTEEPTRFLATSSDGSSWQLTEAPGAVSTAAAVTAAHGPSGWLLVTSNDDHSAGGELWRSGDGRTWQAGDLPLRDRVVPEAVVGHAGGYALSARDDRSGTSEAVLFISRDGNEWEELTGDPFPYSFALHPLENGFIASGETVSEEFVVRTADAEGWTSPEDHAIPGAMPRVVSVGDSVIAVVATHGVEGNRVWRASLDLDSWERQPDLEAILEEIAISYLVASDEWILLAGQEYSDGAEQWWRSSDGVAWERISGAGVSLDDLHGPMAARAGGFMAVAPKRTAAGPNPAFVTTTDGVDWSAPTDSGLPTISSSVIGACPPAPDTMVEWMAIPGIVGAECFGSSPVTFTAWTTAGGGCGGFAPGRFEPPWLASPFASGRLILTPMQVPYAGCGSAAVAPGTDLPALQQWVEVTGHWDDPAAAECRWIPQPEWPFGGPGDLVTGCRATFVATSVTPTSAP